MDASTQPPEQTQAKELENARKTLEELGLEETGGALRPASGHRSSILIPCQGLDKRDFLLKFFVPQAEAIHYPAGVRVEDYPRREAAFYRFLDSSDPDRHTFPAPKTILIDHRDPPRWILLERIAGAVGPAEEVLGQEHVFALLQDIRKVPLEHLMGRRDFPLNRWEVLSYVERSRMMYDPVLFVIGEKRWTRCMSFFDEALRWIETQPQVMVHGDFTEQNILVDDEGRPFLLDFERVGVGGEDHDFAWFWIHTQRSQDWKRQLLERYWEGKVGSDRIRSEWGIRSALCYLALRRLRFGYLVHGENDENRAANMGLLDAALAGGLDLFPI